MISSIILLLVQHFKYADFMPMDLWLKFMICALVEVAVYVIALKRLDKWDLKTNYGRNKND
jgi:hypothetical protein